MMDEKMSDCKPASIHGVFVVVVDQLPGHRQTLLTQQHAQSIVGNIIIHVGISNRRNWGYQFESIPCHSPGKGRELISYTRKGSTENPLVKGTAKMFVRVVPGL